MSLYSEVRYKINYARGVMACCADTLELCTSTRQKLRIIWTLLLFTGRRIVSRKIPIEYDAAIATRCSCEDGLPDDLRCGACPRRVVE